MKTTTIREMYTSDLLETTRMMVEATDTEDAREYYEALYAECVRRGVEDQVNPEEDR